MMQKKLHFDDYHDEIVVLEASQEKKNMGPTVYTQ